MSSRAVGSSSTTRTVPAAGVERRLVVLHAAAPAPSVERAADGRKAVNVEPLPSSLATSMSPPIMRQNWRLIASPDRCRRSAPRWTPKPG